MNIIELIIKKRDGFTLSNKEINYVIKNYLNDKIPDYQISSLLMAIYLKGMNANETHDLTKEFVESGATLDLSAIKIPTVDKHSTGGVGDKTTLVISPILSACGLAVAKMSGRGLGHTGGTIDKLESFPGFNVNLSKKQFINQVNEINIALIGQSKNMVPADKKFYALRDVTGTVNSIPLIASSIMSKKIAAGSENILLDVKVGKGAFMQSLKLAKELAKAMVDIGKKFNKKTSVVISNMEQPLGISVGNIIEVEEAIETLKGKGLKDLTELSYFLCEKLLLKTKIVPNSKAATKLIDDVISSGKALEQFKHLVQKQGGSFDKLDHNPKYSLDLISQKNGFVQHLDALKVGHLAMKLGAGRCTKDDKIDLQAGVKCIKKMGDKVKKGDVLLNLYSSTPIKEEMLELGQNCFVFNAKKVKNPPVIVEYFK